MGTYRTIKNPTQGLYKEKGSKFFGYAFPISSKEDVKVLLEQIKEEHPKARHFCSAFLIKEDKEEYYIANDDGEPNNSAGMPILGQIRSNSFSHVYIVVVRYFGGTKLGVGGLISAYKETAAMCLTDSNFIEVEPQSTISFTSSYAIMGQVLAVIDKNNLNAKIEHLDNVASYRITTEEENSESILALFERIDVKYN
jgi:uncharacterized YigZ family protein